MSSRTTFVRPGRRPPNRYGLLVAAGDVAVLGAFVTVGLLSHGIHPLEFPGHAAVTATPFLLAWALVAPTGGLYRRRTLESLRSTALRTAVVWSAVTLLGAALRATSLFPGGAPPVFVVTNLAFGLAFFLPWRLGVALVARWLPAARPTR